MIKAYPMQLFTLPVRRKTEKGNYYVIHHLDDKTSPMKEILFEFPWLLAKAMGNFRFFARAPFK
jgi:hypothetical protein